MRRDWEMIYTLLKTTEALLGHPEFKQLRDEAYLDLKDTLKGNPREAEPAANISEAAQVDSTSDERIHISRRRI